jgi:putative nucleotidyltransferase with HDIG domain
MFTDSAYQPEVATLEADSIVKVIDIEELVNTKLPPSPGTLMKLSDLLRNSDTPMRQISDAISYEPVLVARILRLANSPLYSPVNSIVSIGSAIGTIGTRSIYDIVVMEMASKTFAKDIASSAIAKKIWEHSLAVAIIARELSKLMSMRGLEEAFICGLLHDFGKFILLSYDPEGFTSILYRQDTNDMVKSEIEQFGFSHAEVGAAVIEKWNLRDEICSTIRHHHSPTQSKTGVVIGHIVEIADIIANLNGYGIRVETNSNLAESESVTKLNLTIETLDNAWANSTNAISEVISAFH